MFNVDLDFNPSEAEPYSLLFHSYTLAEAKK